MADVHDADVDSEAQAAVHEDGTDAAASAEATEGDSQTDGESSDSTDEKAGGPSDELVQRWERQMNRFEEAVNRAHKNPTEQNVQTAAKEKSRLDKMAEQDELDIDPAKAIKEIVSDTLEHRKQSGETQRQYERRIERLEQQNAELAAQVYRGAFERQHPDLAGRYEELVEQASTAIKPALDRLKNANDPDVQQLLQELWDTKWQQVVNKARAATNGDAKAKTKPPPPAKKPQGTNTLSGKPGQSQDGGPTKSLFERVWGGK